MSNTSLQPSDQPGLPGLTADGDVEVIYNETRRSVSRHSAKLDSLLFDPAYLLDPGLSYALRIQHGEAQIWQVEASRKGVTWIAEAKRASGPPSFA